MVEPYDEPCVVLLRRRCDGAQRLELLLGWGTHARFPDARDCDRVEAGVGQLVDELGLRADDIVDGTHGETGALAAAPRDGEAKHDEQRVAQAHPESVPVVRRG